jgi:subtilisin family serine protease
MKYIIDFSSVATGDEITAYLVENSCTVIKVYNNFLKVYLVNSETTPPVTSIVESVVNDDDTTIVPLGEFVPVNQYCNIFNPNYPSINISTTDEKDWWKNYVLSEPDFDNQIVTLSRKGNGVSVYIMDSGIHATHPEFLDSTIINLFSITDNFLDTSGHGTAIASVISGRSCGLTNATLKIVKIFDKNFWHEVNGLFISHGRAICTARNPKCAECFLNEKKFNRVHVSPNEHGQVLIFVGYRFPVRWVVIVGD